MIRRIGAVVILLSGLAACTKTSEQANHPPQITFIYITPSEFSILGKDTVGISFKIEDKNGDIGSDQLSDPNLYIKTGDEEFGATKLPYIPSEFQNPETGFKGTATVRIPATRFTLDSLHTVTGDTITCQLYILDKAGNKSNTITTSEVIVNP